MWYNNSENTILQKKAENMRNSFRKIIPAILAVTFSVAALSGCNQNNTVTFSPNWHEKNIAHFDETETLVYDVTFEKSSGLGFNYSVNYSEGEYTATLQSVSDGNNAIRYTYTTRLTINVVYECNGETSETFIDTVESTVTFEEAKNNLRPLTMHKEVNSHSPASAKATKVEDCYVYYHSTTDIDYTAGTAKDVTVRPDWTENNTSTREYTVKTESAYTQIDNEQLFIALRGINASSSSSPSFSVYSPFVDKAQIVNAQFGSLKTEKFSFAIGEGDKQSREISYYPVTVSLTGKNPGSAQTLYIAEKTSASSNTFRNVVLRYEVPVSLNLGTLTYTLRAADFM